MNLERKLQEDLEIVELQEKLDMTFDPLGFAADDDGGGDKTPPPNTNCGNIGCC